MLKDTLNSLFDNFKERTTNPFLGTLAAVWLTKNWHLVYAILTFNSNSNLHSRLSYIEQHFKGQSFTHNMLMSTAITLGVLVLTYFLLAISRLLADSYEKIVSPYIAKITDKSSVVLKSEFLAVKEVVIQLERRLEEERLAKVGAQNERDSIDKKYTDIKTSQATVVDVSTESSVNNQSSQTNISNSQSVSSMYSVTGSTRLGSDFKVVKDRFHHYLSQSSVRQYSGGYGEDGNFSLQMLIDLPHNFKRLVSLLREDEDIILRSHTSIEDNG